MFGTIKYQMKRHVFHINQLELAKKYLIKRLRYSTAIDPELSYRFYSGSLPIVDITIGQLIGDAIKTWPNRECVISNHQNIRMTFFETINRADKLAAGLKKLGLKRGNRVGVWGPNDVEWFLSFLAIERAGLITVPINPAFQQDELNYCMEKVGMKAIIAPEKFRRQDYGSMLLNTKAKFPLLENIILWSDNHVVGTRRFKDVESLANRVEVEAIGATQNEITPNDACNIQFTSGTTGRPKAPVLSHKSFVNNGHQILDRLGIVDDGTHKLCLNVPLFHAFGMMSGCMLTLCGGISMVLEGPSFNPKNSLEALAREKCTLISGTPTMWINMLDLQERLKLPIKSSQYVFTGGAYTSPTLKDRINKTFTDTVVVAYGSTEATAMAFQSIPGEDAAIAKDKVGRLHNHVEAMVVDEKGQPVPLGTPGELWLRGYIVMKGYWNDPENTSKTITDDGWLKMGDKFILYANGYGEIVGRLKDIIIRGGENISPKEIECFYENHPDILEVSVFGVHDDVYGEEICAGFRLRENSNVTVDDMKEYAKGKIAHFKIPRYIIFVKEFPKTTSGKIQKFILRQQMERDGLVPSSPSNK